MALLHTRQRPAWLVAGGPRPLCAPGLLGSGVLFGCCCQVIMPALPGLRRTAARRRAARAGVRRILRGAHWKLSGLLRSGSTQTNEIRRCVILRLALGHVGRRWPGALGAVPEVTSRIGIDRSPVWLTPLPPLARPRPGTPQTTSNGRPHAENGEKP